MSNKEKKSDFKREQKTESDEAETCCGRLFHTRTAATGKARSPYGKQIVRVSKLNADVFETPSLLDGAVVCKVGRSQAVKALVDEYCQLEVDPQWNLQPVQLTQEWCDMVVL